MKTTRVFASQAVPGMVVAEDVYTFNNQMIIAAGTTLDDKMITRMKFYSVATIIVNKEETVDPTAAPTVDPIVSETTKASSEFQYYKTELPVSINTLKTEIHHLVTSPASNVDQSALLKSVSRLLKKSRNGIHVFDMLHCLRDLNDQTFAHSINVALICYVIGSWLGFSRKELETLTLGGVLHDIGKVTLPPELILKPTKLTDDEYETIKTHSVRGYNILREKEVDNHVKFAAMMHHERCDGSGYPMGLKADQIDSHAKIVAIADVYEAMTSARVYRNAVCPFEVLHVLEDEGMTKYDTQYLMCFLEHLTLSYINSNVRLSNGLEGKIVMLNQHSLSRPVVKCGRKYIDLSTERNIFIVEML